MSGPPEGVEASELWLKLQDWPEPADVVDFPRKDKAGNPIAKIRIRVLSMDEHDRARLRAREKLRKRPHVDERDLEGNNITREVEGDMVARELLCMACTSPTPKQFGDGTEVYPLAFLDPDQMAKKLTADEISILFSYYQMVQEKWGPYEKSIKTEQELNAWIERLAEGAQAFPLALLNSRVSEELTLSLARRSYILCRLLASHLSNLPSTLESDLSALNLDIGYFGEQRDTSTEPGSTEELDADLTRPLSAEDASELARKTFG